MSVVVNGEPRALDQGADVADLVKTLGLPPQAVLVEHNGVALRPGEWGGRTLAEGDQVEIIRIVAGG